jgi:hypothetical protein
MSEMNSIIGICVDELNVTIGLLATLKDAQLGLSQDHKGGTENHFWLSDIIQERVEDISSRLDEARHKESEIISAPTAIDNFAKNIQTMMNECDELREENEKLREKLSENEKGN